MGAQKIALVLIGVLGLTTWLVAGNYRADSPISSDSESLLSTEQDAAPEYITNNLSDEAEYPAPVIQLQQLVTNELIQQQSVLLPSNNLDDGNLAPSVINDAGEIAALRQRLNKLQTINNNN